jgi:SpoIID/LytB domain protein
MVPLLLAVLFGVLTLPAPPAAAATCPAPGGEPISPAATADGDFSITGRGFGHGAGMSQYGARGAARLGCTATQILTTYYPGTTVTGTRITDPIRVGLAEAAGSVTVTAVSGNVTWEACAEGRCEPLPRAQSTNAGWTVTVGEDGAYIVTEGAAEVYRGGDAFTVLRAGLNGTVARVDVTGHRYRWGVLEIRSGAGERGDALTVVVDIPTFDQYLYGLAEVPSAWEPAVLQAQAIAGRTYALARHLAYGGNRTGCRCDVRHTVSDQAYTGFEKESATAGERWVAAVDATSDQVVTYGGEPIEAFYSSSHGGFSESSQFVFGGPSIPYLQPVDDTRWDLASDNPLRTWRVGISAEDVGAATGVGVATAVTLPEPKGHGGRIGDPARGAGGVRVRGTDGTTTLSGPEFRRRLGLRSALFDVTGGTGETPTEAPSEPQPQTSPEQVARVSGRDRIATAVAVSARGWDRAREALLATALAFPDALAAGPLAARLDAPLLLTEPLVLPDAVRAELARLGVERVTILGGTSAVSPIVEEQLRAAGFQTRRVRGDSRYATAEATALAAGPSARGEVALVLGEDWPDAVAAGALAGAPDAPPTLLAQRDALPEPTRRALRTLRPTTVLLVGGPGAISDGVATQLREARYGVRRLSGPTRWATSAAVGAEALSRLDGAAAAVFASGQNFPDALTAGAFAARLGAPLLLVPRDDLAGAPPVSALLRERAADVDGGFVLGGRAAVDDRVVSQLAEVVR